MPCIGWRRYLVIALFPAVFALPQTIDESILPAQLAAVLPVCGHICVSAFIASAWPLSACTNTNDLSCFCTSRSKSGFAIGEIGLQCLASSCPTLTSRDRELSQSIYKICEGQEGAVPNTHTVLTATAPPPSTSTAERPAINANFPVVTRSEDSVNASSENRSNTRITSTPEASSTVESLATTETITGLSTTSLQTTLVSTSTSTSVVLSTSSSTPQSESSSQTAAASAEERGPVDRPQLVGILVGVGVAIIALSTIAVVFYLRCWNKRRKRRAKRSGFDVLPSPRPDFGVGAPKREWYGRRPTSVGDGERLQVPLENRRSLPRLSTTNWIPVNPDAIGIAISPDSNDVQITPRTAEAALLRSEAALLPDKPIYQPSGPVLAPLRPWSDATFIEDDERLSDEGDSVATSSCHTSLGWPSSFPSPEEQDGNDKHLRGYQYASQVSSPRFVPPPVPATESYMTKLKRARVGPLSVDTRVPPVSNGNAGRRSSGGRNHARHRSSSGSKLRYSTESVTSFETRGDDEVENDERLTPVRESYEDGGHDDEEDGKVGSPISPERLRYPAIPRPLSGPVHKGMTRPHHFPRPPRAPRPPHPRPAGPHHHRSPPPPPPPPPTNTNPFNPPGPHLPASAPSPAHHPQSSRPSNPPRPSPLLRNDTYARSEDLVIATTQALTRATGSPDFTKENLLASKTAPQEEEQLKQMHLNDEVERARQGLELMRERAATAAAGIQHGDIVVRRGTGSGGTSTGKGVDDQIHVHVRDPSPSCPDGSHVHTTTVTPLPPLTIPSTSRQPPPQLQPKNLEHVPDWLPRMTPTQGRRDLCLVVNHADSSGRHHGHI